MAAATFDSVNEGQGIVRAIKFTSVSDTNTYAYGGPTPKAWWCAVSSASSSASVQASLSSGTFTFKVSTGSPDVTLFILL